MRTDYKFWYIKRNDAGFITEATIRFYEGDITTKLERSLLDDQLYSVTRYRRIGRLELPDLTHLRPTKFVKDAGGRDVKLYTPDDFGTIKTDNELRTFVNNELKKDPQRSPIQEQT